MVREDVKYGTGLIKFMASGGALTKGNDLQMPEYSPEEMKMMVS
jgi:hypothetical protein